MTMSRPPVIGDLVREEQGSYQSLRHFDVYKVIDVDVAFVKIVLVSEVTPVRGIRKMYKTSNRRYEITHSDFSQNYTLDVRDIYDAEVAVITDAWAELLSELT